MFGLMARIDKKIIPNYNFIEMKHTQIKSQYSLRPSKNIYYGEEETFEDPKDADYIFEEVDDEDEFDDDYEDENKEEDYDEDTEEDYDEEDKQFLSDYYNDPDYNPDEEVEVDYKFLNNNVDKNGEIVLKPGIDNNNDDDDNIECDYHDVIHANGYEPKEELIYNYKNNKLVNVCKRRVENGNAIYTKINM
jgi:hypothetical protein